MKTHVLKTKRIDRLLGMHYRLLDPTQGLSCHYKSQLVEMYHSKLLTQSQSSLWVPSLFLDTASLTRSHSQLYGPITYRSR